MSRRDVDAYLDALEEPKRSTLASLRATLRALMPDAEECISYGMPAFKLDGKAIAGFAAFKAHLSYFPHSGTVLPALSDALAGYEWSKGTLKFAIDRPLPKRLVTKLVRERKRQLDER